MSFKAAHLCAIFNGTADFFLCLYGISQREAVLVGREPAERLGYASRAEQPHPGIELGHEFGKVDAPPVPWMEELLLELAEEALGPSVVAARALARHAPRQPVPLAYRDPPRPAIASAAVAVDRRGLARRQRRADRLEARVRERRVGTRADRPGDGPAVEAIDRGRQVALLAGGDPELGDVGDPQPVGAPRPKPVGSVGAQGQVRRGGQRLAGVAAPLAAGRLLAASSSSRMIRRTTFSETRVPPHSSDDSRPQEVRRRLRAAPFTGDGR